MSHDIERPLRSNDCGSLIDAVTRLAFSERERRRAAVAREMFFGPSRGVPDNVVVVDFDARRRLS